MGRRYTNYDHYCHICGKRIEDWQRYYICRKSIEPYGKVVAEQVVCADCYLTDCY